MILFLQLPLTDHSRGYITGNIEYASAVLSGYIEKKYKNQRCETLPAIITNFGSNELIVKYIINLHPHIVCFTSYLWNIERNLHIAELVKLKNPDIKIFLGGPEIATDSIALQKENQYVDLFIMGEGEWFFDRYLSGLNIPKTIVSGNTVAKQPECELISSNEIYEPLSGRRLNAMMDGSAFIELTRGCPYRCSYCYYSKNFKKVRELPFERLLESLQKISQLSEIYILSPTFDKSTNFKKNLIRLKQIEHKVSLHTEIRANNIDAETAELLYDAGFRSLEVGFQSMNKRALKNIHRSIDTEKELLGMTYLKEANIDIKIGIIPGLPGDTPESFIKTVDTLLSHGFGDNIELYPLMMLPGTEIREMAKKQNITFQSKPPYYYHHGWGFSYNDIKSLTAYVEDKTGFSQSVEYLPDFTLCKNPLFTGGLRGEANNKNIWDIKYILSNIDTSVNDLHIENCTNESILSGVKTLSNNYSFDRYFNIILYYDSIPNYRAIFEILTKNEEDNLHRRLNIYNNFMDGSLIRFFQVIKNPKLYENLCIFDEIVTPLLLVDSKNMQQIMNFIERREEPPALLIESGIYSSIMDRVNKIYSSKPQLLAFASETDMQQFYFDINLEFMRYPYGFGIKVI